MSKMLTIGAVGIDIDVIINLPGEAVKGIDGDTLLTGQSEKAPIEVAGLTPRQLLTVTRTLTQLGRLARTVVQPGNARTVNACSRARPLAGLLHAPASSPRARAREPPA